MPGSEVTVRVHRPAATVFDAIASHCWTNDPACEPEVLGVKPDGGGLRVGGRVVMTRRESGKDITTTYEITKLEPPTRLALAHIDGAMRFALDWQVRPAGGDETDVTVTMSIGLRGWMRLLTPIVALRAPGRTARISADGRRDRGSETSNRRPGRHCLTGGSAPHPWR
jgi:hypothetical protein